MVHWDWEGCKFLTGLTAELFRIWINLGSIYKQILWEGSHGFMMKGFSAHHRPSVVLQRLSFTSDITPAESLDSHLTALWKIHKQFLMPHMMVILFV